MARFEPPALRTIVRERVDRRLDRAWEVSLTVIIGPAGAGKTTAASHLVERSARPSLWYRAHAVDGDEASFCDHLAQAWEHTTATQCRWEQFADVLVGIETTSQSQDLLLVIDEFDAIIGTASEMAVGNALTDIAPSIHLVTLSRHRPSFNLSRLKLADAVCEVGPDDLRFRSWEVDRLFRDLYDRPLLPDEVAELERRTGGWVAALHLFNMATIGLAPGDRRAVLAQIGRRTGPDWDFLADNVLAGLPDELQLFLLETAPLPRLTAPLCDELLESRGSWEQLAELERLQLVTPSVESPGSFRSHEVLRSHLEGLLVEWEGADAVRKRYRRAAESLESHGHFTEALSAYCRGEDWPSAGRLLGARGAEVADRPGTWLGGLPPALVDADPWLMLAVARQQRSDGRVREAIATYQRVEGTALSAVPLTIARRERLLLAALLDRSSPPSLPWVGALRDAAFGDPSGITLDGRSPHDDLAKGIVCLICGEVRAAAELLRGARDRRDASPALSLAAGLGHLVASYLADAASPADADALERAATLLEIPFITRLCRAAAGMVTDDIALIDDVVADCDRAGDAVGAAVARTLASLATVWGRATATATDALARCRATGLRMLEVWVQVAEALADVATGRHDHGAAAAELAARRRGALPLHQLALVAGDLADPRQHDRARRLIAKLREDHGIAIPWRIDELQRQEATVGAHEPLEIQCFGRFAVSRAGCPIDMTSLRPRARAVLRLLAVSVGSGVHRQLLCEELWPDDVEASAARKLHVAISSIRRVLDDAAEVVRRDGELYRLDGRVICDVHSFEATLTEARSLSGAAPRAEGALRRALDLYAGDLLPEDGASEWVETKRRHLRAMAADAARTLAELLLRRADLVEAIEVSRAGIAIDRYADPLWRLLLQALDADGDLAGHARVTTEYDEMLAELGIERSAQQG